MTYAILMFSAHALQMKLTLYLLQYVMDNIHTYLLVLILFNRVTAANILQVATTVIVVGAKKLEHTHR